MSIDEILQGNIDTLNLHPQFHRRLIPANAEQIRLTEEWILPNTDLILIDVRVIRKEVDAKFRKDPEMMQHMEDLQEEYPYGQCKPIRNSVLERMKAEMLNASMLGMQKLKGFIDDGGIIQPFWGIDNGKYFQNAIQIGNAIMDVANDTVDFRKESVILYPELATAFIKPIESFTKYAEIEEKYWKHDVYPNIYLPQLAPIFPIISIEQVRKRSGGYAELLMLQTDMADMEYLNLFSERDGHLCGLASHFIFESEYSKKRLPPEVLETLFNNVNVRQLQAQHPNFFEVTSDPEEAQTVFVRFKIEFGASVPIELISEARKIRDMGLKLERVILGARIK